MAALDGEIVFSDADEFIYDEMVTHVPMAVHPNAKKILIIGGGDGGVAKELIKYPFVEKIDVVETDKMFVDVCRKFFPEVACGLEDSRISMYYDDGLRFLRGKNDEYDLIINDSTDPLGHTENMICWCWMYLCQMGLALNFAKEFDLHQRCQLFF